MMKIIQTIMNKMYQMSLPIDTNDPPNNPEASLITSQSNGMAITNMINANKMKKSAFKIPPITIVLIVVAKIKAR